MNAISLPRVLFCLLAVCVIWAWAADSQEQALPAGAAKDTVVKVCTACHDAAKFRRLRLDEDDWSEKVADMVDRGAQATPEQTEAIVGYLVANFGPGSKVLVNSAPIEELRRVLGLATDEASAIVAWRREHGPFHTWTDLAKVPGVDRSKIEARKDLLSFS